MLDSHSLTHFVMDSVEAAKAPGAVLECEADASVDTESESTNLTVRFAEDESSNASLNLRVLMSRLEEQTVVSAVDLVAEPAQLVILGAVGTHNYRITIRF